MNGLQKFPQGLSHLKNLKEMIITECSQDCDFTPLMQLSSLVNLDLVLFAGNGAVQLPQQLQHLTALRSLIINDFDGIEVLPEWLGNLASLEVLGLYYCRSLKQFPSKKAIAMSHPISPCGCLWLSTTTQVRRFCAMMF
uniref:Uncharacterized protein n=1 Tax=Cucumis sativus TaxID=3659 RepID=A0A0A0KU03_CUCSA